MTMFQDDLTLSELLDDPMTQAVMKADRVDRSELEAMLRALAPRVADAAGRSNDNVSQLECAPSDRKAVGRFLHSMCRGHASRRVGTRPGLRSPVCGTP
jgi:hypothetical protein